MHITFLTVILNQLNQMKKIILFASIMLASGLLFTNVYNSLVDAKSWGSDIPQSLATARLYFKSANPGDFFRVFSPINQLLGLLALIMFWKFSSTVRTYLGIALVLYVLCDVFTFAYFYPRNDILFKTVPLSMTAVLRKAWSGWNTMNWLRSLMLFAGLICSFLALDKIYARMQEIAMIKRTSHLTDKALQPVDD